MKLPPEPAKSYFEMFENISAAPTAKFNDEFGRLAAFRRWKPGSDRHARERAIALDQELALDFESDDDDKSAPLTDAEAPGPIVPYITTSSAPEFGNGGAGKA
ncbi:hypothetical protein B0H63DRAFT_522528 [Podospora didyma]|uniref:Uncharacterized protein n=1 Tax=Podospora didyma TaxID=330526 RepID=A0AAE0NPI5_9PEZI|nr:hypothetical protein B0H63DRAFT_522528 [Podospora didyma]